MGTFLPDILTDWHPLLIGARIKKAMGDRTQAEVAKLLGVTPQYLCDILQARRNLSPQVAARLHRIGLNGRRLYLKQEERRFEIQHRYEHGLMARWNPNERVA